MSNLKERQTNKQTNNIAHIMLPCPVDYLRRYLYAGGGGGGGGGGRPTPILKQYAYG